MELGIDPELIFYTLLGMILIVVLAIVIRNYKEKNKGP